MVTLGIGGGTCAGKTTLANEIAKQIGTQKVAIVHLDSYYYDRSDLPMDERDKINYDHPDAFDSELLVRHINRLLSGYAIEMPIYDYKMHIRTGCTTTIEPKNVLIIEGILVLAMPFLVDMLDIKILVDTATDIRLLRRLRRELLEFGNTFESAANLYLQSARPMHIQFVEPAKKLADLIISGEQITETEVDLVISRVHSCLSAEKR